MRTLSCTTVGPQDFNGHKQMTDKKVSSVERNAVRVTIGNEPKHLTRNKE